MGTDSGNLLFINNKTTNFGNIKVANGTNNLITTINVYKNYVMAVCDNIFYFYKLQLINGTFKINSLFNSKILADGPISRPQFVKHGDSFYLFFIDKVGLKKMILKERMIASIS